MPRALSSAVSGLRNQQTKMDVIGNNVSNVNTVAFKAGRVTFKEGFAQLMSSSSRPDAATGGTNPVQIGLGSQIGSIDTMFTQGNLETTVNTTDLAIQGNSFFMLKKGAQSFYTRAGNFRLDATGRLVTQHGELVEPGITVPPDATQLTIGQDGAVTAIQPGRTDPVNLGQLELDTFTNPAGLNSIGNNLFTPSAGSGEAVQAKPGEQGAGTLAQGMLEGANVKAVEEMIDMIACQRAYELNSKIISTADQMLQRLTNIR